MRQPTQKDIEKELSSTLGSELQQRLTARLPGTGPVYAPSGYTSASDIRESVLNIIKVDPKQLSQEKLHKAGLDVDPREQYRETLFKTKNFTWKDPQTGLSYTETPEKDIQAVDQALAHLAAPRAQAKKLSYEEKLALAEKWIVDLTAKAKRRNRLMTDQQLQDWRMARHLSSGDRARYIGPDRVETTQAGLLVPRPHGQTGIITNATSRKVARTRQDQVMLEEFTFIFHPDQPVAPVETSYDVDKQFVDLMVREHTEGWLQIERVPL